MPVVGLAPGSSVSVFQDCERIRARLVASSAGAVAFVSEGGGRFVVGDTLIVPACPDLLVIFSGNQLAACGTGVRVRVKVRNQGQAAAGSSLTRISLDGVAAGDAFTAAIAAGSELWTDWVTIAKPPGRYLITGCADIVGQVAESSETNNCSQ